MSDNDFSTALLERLSDNIRRINAIDEKMGDGGASARSMLNNMVKNDPEAVAMASEILTQVAELDTDFRLLVSKFLLTAANKTWKKEVDAFIEANTSETSPSVSEEDKVLLTDSRSKLMTISKALVTALAASGEDQSSLPELPAARRGATGPRGPMIRDFDFVVDSQDGLTYPTFGKLVLAVKTDAKKGRAALADQEYDISELPDSFSFTLNGHSVDATRRGVDKLGLEDDEDENENGDDED